MADRSLIEWTDATWNVVTGCSRVSRGCQNCYAERLAATRLRHHSSRRGLVDANGRWTGEVRRNEQWLDQPLRWRKPRKIFVAAHGDLFHENVPGEWLDRIFAVMAAASIHVFQVLTKRPSRAREYLAGAARDRILPKVNRYFNAHGMSARKWPLSNIWLGTSIEDQRTADLRVDCLLHAPAAIRWISAEPLLGRIDLLHLKPPTSRPTTVDALRGMRHYAGTAMPAPAALDWVVAGGESGPRARPMRPEWARDLQRQCFLAEVPFFFKQWGGITSKAGGCELDGRQWRQMPGEDPCAS